MGHGRRVAGRVIRVQSLSNKPLQRMWSPQGHRVESGCRLGGAHTAERQGVRRTSGKSTSVSRARTPTT